MLSGVVDQQTLLESLVEERWKAQPEGVTAPYTKTSKAERTPE